MKFWICFVLYLNSALGFTCVIPNPENNFIFKQRESCRQIVDRKWHSITYQGGARMGDWLICYIHAKWISFQEGIPLIYSPFPYSSEFVLSEKEMHIEEALDRRWTIYSCPYFPESK